MSAVVAGAGSDTAVTYAGWRRNANVTVKRSGATVRQPKVKKPTVKPKTVAGTRCVKKI